MIIEQKFPTYASNPMLGFSKMLGGQNFFPFIRTYKFTFSGEITFTLENLQEILPYAKIIGSVKSTNAGTIQDMLLQIMTSEVNERGEIAKTANEDLIISRVIFFWDCVQADFYQPMSHLFIHEPAQKSYFTDTTQWSFCFVVLNANKGMVVCAKTWKNAIECMPDNQIEAEARKAQGML